MLGKSVLPGSFTGPWELFFFLAWKNMWTTTATVQRVIPHAVKYVDADLFNQLRPLLGALKHATRFCVVAWVI